MMTDMPATDREPVEVPVSRPQGPSGEVNVTLRDVLSVLKRRLVLVVFLAILFGALGTGAWVAAYVYYPSYSGEAFVECISDKPKPVFTTADQALNQKEFERFVRTQAEFVRSPSVLMEVLKSAEVRATQWYRNHQDRLLLEFEDLIQATPHRGTNLLRISAQTRSPADPHVIVNKVVEYYLAQVQENNVGSFRRERDSYQTELEAVNNQIRDKQEQLLTLQKRMPPGFTSFESNASAEGYAEAKSAVAQLELSTQELESLYNVYASPGGAALSPEDLQFVEADPIVAALSNQIHLVQQQLAIERERLGANHREVKRLDQTRSVIEDELNKLRQQKSNEVRRFREEQVQTAWLTSQQALLLARERLADVEAYMADMDSVIAQHRLVEEDIFTLKEKRKRINEYIDDVERIIRERSAIRVEPRQTAIAPLERSFPQPILLVAVWMVAWVFAVGLPLLLDFVDQSLRTPQDVLRHLRLPLLGVLPDADDEEMHIDRLETASQDAPRSMFAEMFRGIRTNLHFASPADRQRSIVITSPRPEDGKTTVACNLAMVLAAGGRRILLVDANFRRPSIHRVFPGDGTKGLCNILVGEGRLAELATRTRLPNLDVLTCGPLPPNPAELLESRQMAEFIREATESYDQVILDAPPLLVASDACILAGKTDGVILVCRARVNSRGIAARACGLLRHVGAHIFGAILNAAQVRRGGYFREQLRTFYEYHPEGDEVYGHAQAAAPKDHPPTNDSGKSA